MRRSLLRSHNRHLRNREICVLRHRRHSIPVGIILRIEIVHIVTFLRCVVARTAERGRTEHITTAYVVFRRQTVVEREFHQLHLIGLRLAVFHHADHIGLVLLILVKTVPSIGNVVTTLCHQRFLRAVHFVRVIFHRQTTVCPALDRQAAAVTVRHN